MLKTTNKAERHRLKMKKYRRRMKIYHLSQGTGNFFAFRSHGKPCSCGICRHQKFRDTDRKKLKINAKTIDY